MIKNGDTFIMWEDYCEDADVLTGDECEVIAYLPADNSYQYKHLITGNSWIVSKNLFEQKFPDFKTQTVKLGALRYDEGKPRLELLPPEALIEISKVFAFGAKKYGDYNWQKGFHWTRMLACLLRHTYYWAMGEDKDPESGLNHMSHAGANVLMILWHIVNKAGLDNRKPNSEDNNA